MDDKDELLDVYGACRFLGGDSKPIHPATFYRAVRRGEYPRPEHPTPNTSRWRKSKLAAALNKRAEQTAAA